MRMAFVFAFAAATFVLGARFTASAVTEYCPVMIQASHRFPPPNDHLYSVVLSARSSRSVAGTLLVQTDGAWYVVDFPMTGLVPVEQRFHNADTRWQRDDYFSRPLYVQFPSSVSETLRWSVLAARSSGDKVFHWDDRGNVTCKFDATGSPTVRLDAHTGIVADTPPPYDLTQPPSPSDVVIVPTPADFAQSVTCDQPFEDATSTNALTPSWPSWFGVLSHPVTVAVIVALSHDGQADDAWVLEPSGLQELDVRAVDAAKHSSYKAARVFCLPAPGYFIFLVRYGGR
jgi:hypothetical protein